MSTLFFVRWHSQGRGPKQNPHWIPPSKFNLIPAHQYLSIQSLKFEFFRLIKLSFFKYRDCPVTNVLFDFYSVWESRIFIIKDRHALCKTCVSFRHVNYGRLCIKFAQFDVCIPFTFPLRIVFCHGDHRFSLQTSQIALLSANLIGHRHDCQSILATTIPGHQFLFDYLLSFRIEHHCTCNAFASELEPMFSRASKTSWDQPCASWTRTCSEEAICHS